MLDMEHLLCALHDAKHVTLITFYFNPHTKVGREVLQPSLVRQEIRVLGH